MILLLHLAATGVMIGIIWFVQVVHYPLLARVGRDAFAAYEQAHTRLTTYVVGPPMLLELGTGVWLAYRPPAGVPRGVMLAGLALIAVIWISTFLLQVPEHGRLERGWDPAAHRRLVRGNAIRTAAWTLRGVLVIWIVAGQAGG